MFRRYPLVRQHDETDCGAAALATILLYHRRPAGLEKVRDYTGTDRQGSSLLGLVQAAQRLGFSAQPVKGPYDALSTVPLPAIAHTRNEQGLGHFVVLYRVRKSQVVLADPVGKLEKISRDSFCKRWTGYLLLLAPEAGKEPVATGELRSPWRRLLGLLSWHLPILAEAFLCALLMAVLGITTSFFIQQLVDNVLIRQDVRLLNALGLGMIFILIFRILFGTLRQYLLAVIGRKIDLSLVSSYHRHLLELPLRFFEMRRVGEILSRIGDADKVRQAISGTTLTVMVDGTLVSCLSVVLWLYDLPLAMVATAFVPLLVLSLLAHHGPVRRLSRLSMEQHAALAAHLVEDVSGVETIKSFGMHEGRLSGGETRLVRFVQSLFSMQKLSLRLDAIGTAVTALASIAILWYGGHRVMQGAITVGQLLFFSSLLGYLLDPLARLASVNLALQDALVAVDRLYQVLDLEPEVCSAQEKVTPGPICQGLELNNVSFRYGSRGKVLEGINLRLAAGETVAIVGESGSGKSTLLKLLLGFYAPTEGSILVDGVDLRDIDLATYRQRIGWVSQDPFIFTGTIRENIAMGHARATLNEVSAAAAAAGLSDLINSLPDRYETVIGERGANLSGGQRQRLAIARALLRQPDLLIFDEATSHLDTATERAIQKSLRTALVGKTVLLVAHRLSTVKDADRILVLQQGRVAEEGDHRQLMARRGLYAALWQAQTEEDEELEPWLTPPVVNGWHEPINGAAGRAES